MIRGGLLGVGVLTFALLTSVAAAQESRDGEALVVAATSGNTINVQFTDGSAYTVRLIGVNAPRIDAPDIGTECYGLEARDFLSDLVTGTTVRLEREVSDASATGRLLRHVWVRDANTGAEIPLAVILVSQGYTEADAIPPDTMMAEQLAALDADARSRGIGRWGACP